MDPMDFSSLGVVVPFLREERVRASRLRAGNIRHPKRRRSTVIIHSNTSAPQSSRGHRESAESRFACPFHKHDPETFNSWDFEQCAKKYFTDMSTLV